MRTSFKHTQVNFEKILVKLSLHKIQDFLIVLNLIEGNLKYLL